MHRLSSCTRFSILLKDRDLSAQLAAVKEPLRRNQKVAEDLNEAIERLDQKLAAAKGEEAGRLGAGPAPPAMHRDHTFIDLVGQTRLRFDT